MTWVTATNYRAKIGGLGYVNVAEPVVLNNQCVVTLSRNCETGELGASFELVHQDGSAIASIKNNQLSLHNVEDFVILKGRERIALFEKQTGRIWCDIISHPLESQSEHELEVSCIIFTESRRGGVFLHPDRTKFGQVNGNELPNVSSITITSARPGWGRAIRFENLPLYLVGVCFEDLGGGIDIVRDPL